ncbi:hypothetical protein D3C76_833610 [compost metagenome]|uniref:Uncharacterized protein n=1 Tax=Pseudomonas jinjuensis TaxID=198616 RepID=A0A1H0HCY5_9PSED|nr:hypothetical protein [Pseudomonas jinjuensis]SDO16953.1 hypothetical protein SAMN05216193_108183 [Pseudomonas jinjuensis]
MATEDIRAALRRVETLLQQRPEAGLHDDAPATARWTGGVSTLASHVDGLQLRTDLAPALGGAGAGVTPGWLVRAGRDVPAQRLRELVQRSQELSPVSCALEAPLPVRVDIAVEDR